jgi:hypothetical protein
VAARKNGKAKQAADDSKLSLNGKKAKLNESKKGKGKKGEEADKTEESEEMDEPVEKKPKTDSDDSKSTPTKKKRKAKRLTLVHKKAKKPETAKEDIEESPPAVESKSKQTSKKSRAEAQTVKLSPAIEKDLAKLLNDLVRNDNAWPFLVKVDEKDYPDYYEVIKEAIDFEAIKTKLKEKSYKTKEDFAYDVRLIFDNCEYYNEDDSEIGKAGHKLRAFFETKWLKLFD